LRRLILGECVFTLLLVCGVSDWNNSHTVILSPPASVPPATRNRLAVGQLVPFRDGRETRRAMSKTQSGMIHSSRSCCFGSFLVRVLVVLLFVFVAKNWTARLERNGAATSGRQ